MNRQVNGQLTPGVLLECVLSQGCYLSIFLFAIDMSVLTNALEETVIGYAMGTF